MKHCWHEKIKTGTGLIKSYGVEVCCFCGLEHNPYALVPRKDHGSFDPDKIPPSKPDGECIRERG